MKTQCETEIIELHQFFEDWFSGRLKNSDAAFRRFEGVMAEGFTYEEWQDTGQGERGRISSVLFRRRERAPNGVEWLHVHETWIS